jgi:hypothetical protein
MARRDKEAMQDIAMHHMEKIARNNPNEDKPKSLAEQLKEAALSPEERRKRMPAVDWHRELRDLVYMGKGPVSVGPRLFQYVTAKYKKEIEDIRVSGAHFKEAIAFCKSKADEYINM